MGLRNIFVKIEILRKFEKKSQICSNPQYRTCKIEIILSCIFIPIAGMLMALVKIVNKALK